jgi:hypothetical protein
MMNVDRGKLLTRLQSTLEILPAETSDSKKKELAKGIRIWPCKVFLLTLASEIYMMVKSYDTGTTVLLPLRRK